MAPSRIPPLKLIVGVSMVLMALLLNNHSGDRDDSGHYHVFERLLSHAGEMFTEEHPPLLPLSESDYTGFMFAILGLMVAAGGGIGGGGILVPIYILILNFSPKHAIPLSNITVFGGSIANNFLNSKKRHPMADRPLVDWDLVLVMEPLTIAGALVGTVLNKVLPEILLATLLVILLSATAYNTLTKAVKLYKKETEMMRGKNTPVKESELTRLNREIEENIVVGDGRGKRGIYKKDEKPLDGRSEVDEDEEDDDDNDNYRGELKSTAITTIACNYDDDDLKNEESEEEEEEMANERSSLLSPNEKMDNRPLVPLALQELLDSEKSVNLENIGVLVTMFGVVLLVNVLKGGGEFSPLGITCGSIGFWFANFFIFLWILAVSSHCRNLLLTKYRLKKEIGYRYIVGDIIWDESATVKYPFVCMVAGFFAGMFGVGGGIVKGPLMIAMGVHPKVASATSACMIFFTSFTATTSFIVFGLLIFDYGIICLVIGFFSTLVGQILLNKLMRKYDRNSYIAFSIGGVVLLSAFLMTAESVLSLAEGEKSGSGGLCGNDT